MKFTEKGIEVRGVTIPLNRAELTELINECMNYEAFADCLETELSQQELIFKCAYCDVVYATDEQHDFYGNKCCDDCYNSVKAESAAIRETETGHLNYKDRI
jgi:hypothetical protein